MKHPFALLLATLLLCGVSGELRAQTSHDGYSAYGVRFGWGHLTEGGDRRIYNAYYDVPMGAILFVPELIYWDAQQYAAGFNVKIKVPLTESLHTGLYADSGIEFMTWADRAHIGVPIDLSVTRDVSSVLQVEASANYTPVFFLGGEPDRGMFSILAGIRIVVE